MNEFKRKKMELLCESKIVELYKDYLETPDGRIVEYDFIKHKKGGGAGILLVDENEFTYLVRQYRNAIDRLSVEIPAGAFNFPEEDGKTCALREAEEETGFIPQKIYHVTRLVSSIGTFDETTDVYIGTNLKKGKKHFDENEFIELLHVPISEAIKMIFDGTIVDSKTIAAIFAYKEMKFSGIIE
ncbi:MAG: NUDIX hydrolase [Lachnospiraceae bacterium]|nr:NUDIX hydrolase [Lachnospiraceae bacterium]